MNIRSALKADFNIDVRITDGSGRRADPFVIEPCSAAEACRTQLNLLRGLGKGRGELWRLLEVETHQAGRMQSLHIEAILLTDAEVVTERRALFFDISAVAGLPDALPEVVEWRDDRTVLAAPFQVGWLHFDKAIDNKPGDGTLDASLLYSSAHAKATLYVYGWNASGPTMQQAADTRAGELARVCEEVRQLNPSAETPWPIAVHGPFALQHFLIEDNLSVAGIAVLGPHFVKLRLTYLDDPKMRELMSFTVNEFRGIVEDHRR